MSCQVIDMARRYGWTIALTREDHICSLGITAIGFDKPLPIYNVGTLCEGMYTETKEAGRGPRRPSTSSLPASTCAFSSPRSTARRSSRTSSVSTPIPPR